MTAAKTEVLVSNFQKNYRDIYYGRELVALKSIEELPGTEMGVKITLSSPVRTFSHFGCSVVCLTYAEAERVPFENYRPSGDEVFQELPPDNVIIANQFIDDERVQEKIFLLKPVFTDGTKSEIQTITVRYMSSKFFKAHKMSGHPNIISIRSNPCLNIGTGSVADWVISKPTEQEKAFARQKWGNLVRNAKNNYGKAKILAKTLMHDLWPHNGHPSDKMAVPPFEQYERMVSGKDKGNCGNFTAIFVCACNALGIPARHIGLSKIYSNGETSSKCKAMNIQIQGGSCHGVPEIFDDRLNQWIWMDLRLYSLGAWIGNTGPLTLAEFHLFINQEQRRRKLKLLVYDIENRTEKLIAMDKSPAWPGSFTSFFGWNTTLSYSKSAKQ